MGCGSSSSTGRPRAPVKSNKNYSALPEDAVPYPGLALDVRLIEAPVKMKTEASLFGLSGSSTTTDIDAYYPVIAAPYAEGFTLSQFAPIPGAFQRSGMFSMGGTLKYQAILSKQTSVEESWQLHIVKSYLAPNMMNSGFKMLLSSNQGTSSDSSHLYQIIAETCAQGGRLLCIEPSMSAQGPSTAQALQGKGGVMGMDLFFNMAKHPNPTTYSYQAIHVPINFKMQAGMMSASTKVELDWHAQLQAYLSQGWKLVDIFFDAGSSTEMGFMSASGSLNSVWFFEKDNSKLEDNTPLYEGAVVEYWQKITMTMTGTTTPHGTWNECILTMGQRGWELASIVMTPESKSQGTTVHMKLVLLFQRRIMAQSPAGTEKPVESTANEETPAE
ncbi:uncharacterized protein LOC144433843 [Glandiceps talaboti]